MICDQYFWPVFNFFIYLFYFIIIIFFFFFFFFLHKPFMVDFELFVDVLLSQPERL